MIRSDLVPYRADGLEMIGTLYADTDARRGGGVLVFPEAFGPGRNVHDRARRLADLGYSALVCDLHGGGALIEDFPKVMELVHPLRESPLRARARAAGALEALGRQPGIDAGRIAAIGFCIGGTLALELARSGADIRAVVGFHAGLGTSAPQDATAIRGKVLVCIGADDPSIPPSQRLDFENEMKAGGVDWTMHVYGGVVHAFTNRDADTMGRPEFARYDAAADRQSWTAMTALLTQTLAAPGNDHASNVVQ